MSHLQIFYTDQKFSEVWPRQILDLGKQFNLMMSSKRLEDIFTRRLEDVLKTAWTCLEDIFARRLADVLKISWWRFYKSLEDVLKASWRRLVIRLEDVLKTSWRRMAKTNILVLMKTSWRRLLKSMTIANIFVLTKTSWRLLEDFFKISSEDEDKRRMFAG